MSKKFFVICVGLFLIGASLTSSSFQEITTFPSPAPNSFSVTGANLSDGRLVIWNGETIYFQDAAGGDSFAEAATGYLGDPGFLTLSPDGHTVLLGAGFSPALYLFDTDAPVDFVEGTQIDAPNHFGGAFLSEDLVILDRSKDDWSGSELVIFDLSSAKSLDNATTVLSLPPNPGLKQQILNKPDSSYPSSLSVCPSGTTLYVMDANTRELRSFSVSALIAAHEAQTTLDWATDGTPIGEIGDFYSGGVVGVTPDGYLINAGSEGYLMPGGVRIIDPSDPASVIATFDPAETQDYYSAIYNTVTGEIIATTGAQETYAIEFEISNAPFGCMGEM